MFDIQGKELRETTNYSNSGMEIEDNHNPSITRTWNPIITIFGDYGGLQSYYQYKCKMGYVP